MKRGHGLFMTHADNFTANFANGTQTELVVRNLLNSDLSIASPPREWNTRADHTRIRLPGMSGWHHAGFHRRRLQHVGWRIRLSGLRLALETQENKK